MALCIDVVLNHTAAEHPLDRATESFYRTFPDRTEPDAYERTLPEVFPDTAPGSFTWVEDRWVWTTFNAYQWDLDYTNPDVFVAMAEAMLALAAVGVDVLRLDAAPFLWKRLGTNCQNQPEVHELLQAFRAVLRIAAPAVAFKAEAIVAPARPRPLPGHGPPRGQGVRPRLPQRAHGAAVERARVRPGGADDAHAAGDAGRPAGRRLADLRALPRRHRLGDHARGRRRASARTRYLHRRFLADFYAGEFPGTFARGARFQPDPRTGRGAHERHARVAGGARGGARDEVGRRARDPARPAAVRGRLRARRAAADLHGRRARAAATTRRTSRTRAARRQPLDAPAGDGLGGGRAPPRPGDGRGPAVGRAAAAGRGAPRDARDPRPGRRRADLDRQRPRLRARAASRPASGCSCWRTSPPTRSPCLGAHRPRLRADRGAAATAGRPRLEAYDDFSCSRPTSTCGSQAIPRMARDPDAHDDATDSTGAKR